MGDINNNNFLKHFTAVDLLVDKNGHIILIMYMVHVHLYTILLPQTRLSNVYYSNVHSHASKTGMLE